MSLSAQHYQDQQTGRKGRQKPPSETATQHGVAGSRAPIFGLRLECCDVKRRVQNLQKLDDGWPESEKGKDVDVKYIEERRRCEKISEERMNI